MKLNKESEIAKAALLQSSIMDNDAIEILVGKKKYKIKRLGNWVSGRIDKLIAQCQFIQTEDKTDTKKVITTMSLNREVVPKCLSYMILKNPIKVFFFHWIYWRYLHLFFGQYDYSQILQQMYSGEEAQFFFRNMTSLQMNNMLTMEMTRADMRNIAQKLASGASTTQSSPSMGS